MNNRNHTNDRRTFLRETGATMALAPLGMAAVSRPTPKPLGRVPVGPQGPVRAVDFESRETYRSPDRPGYACWVSFFPGERGQWYLTCSEITRPEKLYPKMTREQWYVQSQPTGYDHSRYQMWQVILESTDHMKSWKVLSRQPRRYPGASFSQARTRDGRFLHFAWTVYSLEANRHAGEILYVSSDNGQTWQKQPAFHDRRFFSYPHRLRMLRDGTLVLAIPFAPPYGPGTDCPIRGCTNLNADTSMQMNLCFSYDQGRTWTAPLPIYGGQNVAETDFVELPSGDLLCINNSIFGRPGRQMIYRTRQGWVPAPFEKILSKVVPETVALTEDGLLVGCLRNSRYLWSDDLGLTWFPLEGIPEHIAKGRETYQPWIQYLGNGRFANAGHYGGDNFFGELDQYVMIHFFRVERLRKTKNTRIDLVRDFDEAKSKWRNAYTLKLTCDAEPLAGKELEFWFVERGKPGYDPWNKISLEERMKMGGELIRVRTAADGTAHVALPRLDQIDNIHHHIQLVARFNADRSDPDYKPAQTPGFVFYSNLSY